jgi:hypothetical protein
MNHSHDELEEDIGRSFQNAWQSFRKGTHKRKSDDKDVIQAKKGGVSGTMVKGQSGSWQPDSHSRRSGAGAYTAPKGSGPKVDPKGTGASGMMSGANTQRQRDIDKSRGYGPSDGGPSPIKKDGGPKKVNYPTAAETQAAAAKRDAKSSPATPAKKPQSKNMDDNYRTWAKANPKLASKVKPGQAGYNAINTPKTGASAATAKTDTKKAFSSPQAMNTPKISTSGLKTPKVSSPKVSTPKPAASKPSGTSRIDAATNVKANPSAFKFKEENEVKKSQFYSWREAYESMYSEGFKKFPSAKVQDKAAMKPDTAKGESQARRMDTARTAHTDKRTKDDAKEAVKEREMDNRKTGLERTYKKSPSHKNKAYELEAQRRKDLDKRMDQKSKGHSKMEESFEHWLTEKISDEDKEKRRIEDEYARTGESKEKSDSMKDAENRQAQPSKKITTKKNLPTAENPHNIRQYMNQGGGGGGTSQGAKGASSGGVGGGYKEGKQGGLGSKPPEKKDDDQKNEAFEMWMEGKKDACYHKVKARYDVWPSAYASGALVKCRKKGASNWGNSSKKD